MTRYYWYKNCPLCGTEGELTILHDIKGDKLYLQCAECYSAFSTLEAADGCGPSWLNLGEDEVEYVVPDREVIEERGWGKYALHRFDDERGISIETENAGFLAATTYALDHGRQEDAKKLSGLGGLAYLLFALRWS